jgi:hypothetical protein
MRTPPIPIPNIALQQSPVVQWIVYMNCVEGVDACFVKDYSVAVHAHSTPSGLLMAREQYPPEQSVLYLDMQLSTEYQKVITDKYVLS